MIGLKLNILERDFSDGSCVQLSFSVTSIQQNTNKQYVEITFRPLFGNHTLFVRTTFFSLKGVWDGGEVYSQESAGSDVFTGCCQQRVLPLDKGRILPRSFYPSWVEFLPLVRSKVLPNFFTPSQG